MIDAAKMSVMVLLLAAAAYGAYLSVNKTNLSELVSELFNEGTNSQATEEAHVSVADSILQTKVDSTVASARIYRKRMGTYDGVCRDITVVAPVACKETNEQFVIFVPLSNATEYCVDSTGKVSNAVDPSPEAVRCN